MSNAWYALQTWNRQERLAQASLQKHDITTFLPQIEAWHQTPYKGFFKRIEPLFPCYILIQCDLTIDLRSRIHSQRGVRSLVQFGDTTPSIPLEVIQDLQERTFNGDFDITQPSIGDKVEILDNSCFHGYFGKLDSYMSGQQRAIILIETLQGNIKKVTDANLIAIAS